jgi:hypothetical protein
MMTVVKAKSTRLIAALTELARAAERRCRDSIEGGGERLCFRTRSDVASLTLSDAIDALQTVARVQNQQSQRRPGGKGGASTDSWSHVLDEVGLYERIATTASDDDILDVLDVMVQLPHMANNGCVCAWLREALSRVDHSADPDSADAIILSIFDVMCRIIKERVGGDETPDNIVDLLQNTCFGACVRDAPIMRTFDGCKIMQMGLS